MTKLWRMMIVFKFTTQTES